MEAFMIAHDQMVKGRKDLLIVILKEKINVDKLPPNLRVYISKLFPLSFLLIHVAFCAQVVRMYAGGAPNFSFFKKFVKQKKDILLTDFNLDLSNNIYLISGTHNYTDCTENLANMKKRLRFQRSHIPLKVLQ